MIAADALLEAWRALRSEGSSAVVEHYVASRRFRSFSPAPRDWRPASSVPVLRVVATAPIARFGGLQVQLLARLAAEARQGPVALLYPLGYTGSGWRLEVEANGERRALTFPLATRSRWPGDLPVDLEDTAFETAVETAADVIGARAIHVEGLAGMPLTSLRRLRRPTLLQIISLHDFGAFCPRPQLLEHPVLGFCGYCRDLERCGRCLRESWPVDDAFQAARRRAATALLTAADALVFPSDFLLRTHRDLFPGLPVERSRVIAPAGATSRRSHGAPSRPARPLRHVAFVGTVQMQKGALVFAETVRRLRGSGIRWSSYGQGEPAMLGRLRELPDVKVRGFYRQGALPRLLRGDGVDLVLLLSIVPESYSLTLDECVRAGVPVVAFDVGALRDRVPELGAGRLVPSREGAGGIVAALEEILRDGRVPVVPPRAGARLPDAATAAAAMRAVYRDLRL